jgi:YbgC/YbaW family acyl-CoA thioester hydrolase
MSLPFVDFTVYPDECDAYGHLNQASFLSLFERARWEMLARTVGMAMFTSTDVWPAVRRSTIEYHAQALPGDRLRFEQRVSAIGRTSFTMQQTARHAVTGTTIASLELIFVCVDRAGRPISVPDSFRRLVQQTPDVRRLTINGASLAVETKGDGPAILFVHGYPLGGFIWRHQVDNLTGWRRLNPDLRGLGTSSTVPARCGAQCCADCRWEDTSPSILSGAFVTGWRG